MNSIKEEITLYPNKIQWTLALLASMGVMYWSLANSFKGDNFSFFCSIMSALMLLLSVVMLLPGSSWLKIDRQGIKFAHIFKITCIKWHDIQEFGTFSSGPPYLLFREKYVGLNFRGNYKEFKNARSTAKALTGFEGSLPDSYGKKPTHLAEILNQYLSIYSE